jgi:hypothetical protein
MLDTNRREFIALVGGGGLLLAAKVKRARGQQPAMPVVGFFNAGSPATSTHRDAAFRQGLRETGFVEGLGPLFTLDRPAPSLLARLLDRHSKHRAHPFSQ